MLRISLLGLILAVSAVRSFGVDGKSTEETIQQLEQHRTLVEAEIEKGDFLGKFSRACATADDAQCARLGVVLGKVPPASYYYNLLSKPLLEARFRLATEKLRTNPPAMEFANVPSQPPVIGLSADVEIARNLYYKTVKPYQALVETCSKNHSIDYQSNRELYSKLTNDLLRQQTPVHAEDFLAYGWAGWCGTGSDSFTVPNSQAVFLSLFLEKRYPEAVGAALSLQEGFNFKGEVGLDPQEFLALCTPDWEQLVVGALADRLACHPEYGPFADPGNLLSMLAQHGTEKGALQLIEISGMKDNPSKPICVAALGAFLLPSPKKNVQTSDFIRGRYSFHPDRKAGSVSLATQQKIVDFFSQVSSADASYEICEAVANALNSKDLPGSKQILRRLLQSPSKRVSLAAGTALGSLGESFSPVPQLPPVSLQLQINGKPLRKTNVAWTVGGESRSVSSDATTSDEGTLAIPFEYLVDPSIKAEGIYLTSPHGKSPEDPIFFVSVPKPENLQKQFTVPIKLQPLELLIRPPSSRDQSFYQGKTMSVSLRRTTESEIRAGLPPHIEFTRPASDTIRFTQLQPDAYSLKITLPGASIFSLNLIDLNSPSLEVQLEPGADVQMKVKAPEGWQPASLKRMLFRDGKEVSVYDYFNYETGSLCGLPYGNYVLRFPASTNQENGFSGRSENTKDFAETEVSFHVDEKSPETVNLGEIQLKPPPASR